MSFPSILQRNQMDCGPTCLFLVSKFHGRNFSIEKLRELTEIGKEGVNMLGISDAAEKIGYRTQAMQLNSADIRTFAVNAILQQAYTIKNNGDLRQMLTDWFA